VNTVYFDANLSDERRREQLYEGALHVLSPTPSSLELCRFAQQLAREAFGPHDPELAQDYLAVEKYVEVLAALKPKFIHHPRCKELIREMLNELGCDIEKTYFDVPRLRTMTNGDYLTAGLAYAFHPHRDTWFSAPPSQLNWWIPVYDIGLDNTIAFFPRYNGRVIPNSSSEYNYYKWNQESRRLAATQIKSDSRKQPQALEPIDMDAQVRVVCKAGGIILFSGNHLHATVPSTSGRTRFSIDFRTVHLDDVLDRRGADAIDSECTGTTLRDFLRASDGTRMPDEIAEQYDTQPHVDGELIFTPTSAAPSM
jgi:phytanoyl-CoA dioxygenase PhyH